MYRFYATENLSAAEKEEWLRNDEKYPPSQRDIPWEDYDDEKVINQAFSKHLSPGFLRSLMRK